MLRITFSNRVLPLITSPKICRLYSKEFPTAIVTSYHPPSAWKLHNCCRVPEVTSLEWSAGPWFSQRL